MLGVRETSIYGSTTLQTLNETLQNSAEKQNAKVLTYQSNSEQELIERLHLARTEDFQGMILNPGGFTHTSVALRDAVIIADLPFVEVHISNPYAREDFRAKSYFSDIAQAVIAGIGIKGYQVALTYLLDA